MATDSDGRNGKYSDEQLFLLTVQRSIDRHRTLRILIVCVAIPALVWVAGYWLNQIANAPVWLALLLGAGGPTFVLWIKNAAVKQFTRSFVARQARLESKLDPTRTSSGLNEDGTSRWD